jgi:hypothetical protein
MNRKRRALYFVLLFVSTAGFLTLAGAQQTTPADASSAPHKVPAIDGGLGRCVLELTVTTPDGKPADAATVKIRIAYGFAGIRKLDLEAGTNVDGKVKFTGLPARVRQPPLEFHASKDQLEAVATFDPSAECHAERKISLEKPNVPKSE